MNAQPGEENFQAKESSNIDWARYANGKLRIDFKNKAGVKVSTYEYDGTLAKDGTNPTGCFPPAEWISFKASTSKGQYFAYHIRPVYKGVKL